MLAAKDAGTAITEPAIKATIDPWEGRNDGRHPRQ